MTVLTTIAVFTIGLVAGFLVAWRLAVEILDHLLSAPHLKLTSIRKCANGHIHACVNGAGSKPLWIVLEDKTLPNEGSAAP